MIATPATDLFDADRIHRLTRFCARLGARDDADDLVQETLLEAWRHADRLHDPSAIDAWLGGIARNVVLRQRRAAAREHRLRVAAAADARDADGENLAVDVERRELAATLDGAIRALPDATREAVIRRFVFGWSLGEIARRDGASTASIAMRLSRARVVLQRVLSAQAGDQLAEFGLAGAAASAAWRQTRLWCPVCGEARLDIQQLAEPPVIRLRCVRCSGDPATPSAEYRLDNASLRSWLGDAARPSTIVRRAARWVHGYFGSAANAVRCTGCGSDVSVRPYRHPELRLTHADGVSASCERCNQAVSVSAVGMALALPEAAALRASAGRIRIRSVGELEASGTPALRIAVEAVADGRRLTAVLARESLRPLVVDSRA